MVAKVGLNDAYVVKAALNIAGNDIPEDAKKMIKNGEYDKLQQKFPNVYKKLGSIEAIRDNVVVSAQKDGSAHNKWPSIYPQAPAEASVDKYGKS